ncbi:type II toxin-antitoxin system HipA family toxin [uncultured Sphingomonas sp.]|uniref:type II toxin-antitoxin system HipA family toxin n=1 Tax=uncultured Sphingomonas sp. TaxID=158754 RepID=UPI00259278EA|nr:type II toxin-antitoxin system HipA family toxin [uncultured Sphingomonas sp.]
MRSWRNTGRISVGLNFGDRDAAPRLGEAAVAAGRIYLQFDAGFVAAGINPSPIRMQLTNDLQEGARDLEGLPGLLHDSMPDGWARLVLDRALRNAGYDHTSLTAIDRLALVGADGSGALTYDGPRLESFEAPAVDFDTAAALVGRAPEEEDGDRIRDALTLTGSLGGARPKVNAWRLGDAFSTSSAPGARLWLAKFPAKGDGPDAGAVEYAYSLMAGAAGVEMPPTTLLPSTRTAGYFAVERFDRTPTGGRLHMHSLGGLLNASTANSVLGYEALMRVTGQLTQREGADVASIEQQIARMAFNVLARNRDDHVKNHAFLMDDKGSWRPSPAFDLTYSNLPEHALLVGGAGRNPGISDMLDVARSVGIADGRANAIIERVRSAVGDWRIHAKSANVSPALLRDIDSSLNDSGDNSVAQAAYLAWSSGRGR